MPNNIAYFDGYRFGDTYEEQEARLKAEMDALFATPAAAPSKVIDTATGVVTSTAPDGTVTLTQTKPAPPMWLIVGGLAVGLYILATGKPRRRDWVGAKIG